MRLIFTNLVTTLKEFHRPFVNILLLLQLDLQQLRECKDIILTKYNSKVCRFSRFFFSNTACWERFVFSGFGRKGQRLHGGGHVCILIQDQFENIFVFETWQLGRVGLTKSVGPTSRWSSSSSASLASLSISSTLIFSSNFFLDDCTFSWSFRSLDRRDMSWGQ